MEKQRSREARKQGKAEKKDKISKKRNIKNPYNITIIINNSNNNNSNKETSITKWKQPDQSPNSSCLIGASLCISWIPGQQQTLQYRPRKNILVDGQLPKNEEMNPQIAMLCGK